MSVVMYRIENEQDNSIPTNQSHPHVKSTIDQITSASVQIRQLQTDLRRQHQQDKNVFNELNRRFHLCIDRIQFLQSQNFKYLSAIEHIRRQCPDLHTIPTEDDYLAFKSNLFSLSDNKIDYEWDYEIFQLQIKIYQQLITMEEQSNNNQLVSLEQQFNQSTSILNTLYQSYQQLQYDVDHLHKHHNYLSKQYFTLTIELCNTKRQQNKWHLTIETLTSYVTFYRHLHLYTAQESAYSLSNMKQSWTLELQNLIQRIRQDFEAFYGNIYQQMITYYETKTEQLEISIKDELEYRQTQLEKFTKIQQKLQIEFDKLETILNYEKNVFIQLETIYNQLADECTALHHHQDQQLTQQFNQLYNVQENIITIVFNIDQIRQSNTHLEAELIIYRQLLNSHGIDTSTVRVPLSHTITNENKRKFIVKKWRKGSIGIKECAPNGTYISLMNFSSQKTIDLSRWILSRRFYDTKIELQYTIPDRCCLEPGKELRIYAKSNHTDQTIQSTSYQILINTNINSWNHGNKIKTYLFNHHGGEEASYKQSIPH